MLSEIDVAWERFFDPASMVNAALKILLLTIFWPLRCSGTSNFLYGESKAKTGQELGDSGAPVDGSRSSLGAFL